MDNHLSKTKGVVFDRDNRVRFCDTDPQILWNIIDFTRYQNTVISSELIFRDYREEMDALDIRDGYELFCFIKSSASACAPEQLKIHFRRIPTIVFDNASESEQALKLLREWSPISSNEYFEAYEEKYGTKFETVKGNPTVSNLLKDYYLDGQFVIDAPTVDERDEQQLLFALEKKPLWFTSELEKLFEQTCMHTNSDAINRASLRRLGYILHTTYAHKASYGSASNFFNEYVFSKDIVDLTSLDRRMVNLQMFATVLDKKRTSLEYIETSPKLLMSISKVYEVYGLSIDEIREIQLFMSTYYNTPFFNGRSLWHNVENHPLIQKLKGNDWMLTCIMKQQASMRSLPVAGGIILSRDGSSLSISNICEWLVSFSGKMTINELVKAFNGTFGSKVKTYKFAEKLKSSDAWNRVVTESLDEYIDGFVNASLSEINVDDLLQEEFY